MMMTTSLAEEFIILGLGKTMPALLIQTTVCQHSDDDDGDDYDILMIMTKFFFLSSKLV